MCVELVDAEILNVLQHVRLSHGLQSAAHAVIDDAIQCRKKFGRIFEHSNCQVIVLRMDHLLHANDESGVRMNSHEPSICAPLARAILPWPSAMGRRINRAPG